MEERGSLKGKNQYRFGEYEGEPVVFIKASNADVEFIADRDDFEKISKHTWSANRHGYPQAFFTGIGIIPLYQFVNGKADGCDTDHINRNRLDNRKSNLRLVPRHVNNRNRKRKDVASSGFRCVTKCGKLWKARVGYKGEKHLVGYYWTPEEASKGVEEYLAHLDQKDECEFFTETGRKFDDPGEPVTA